MTTISRRQLRAAAALTLLSPASGRAQQYPARPVRIIVPFPPGGSSDIHGRIVAQRLSTQTGRSFVVENRGGAGGNVGMAAAAQAAPDGYTIVQATAGTIALTPAMSRSVPYDSQRDFVAIAFTAREPNALIVNPALPVRSFAELVAHARARPNTLFYGSSGPGTPSHLGLELLAKLRELAMTHVPYRGAAPSVADVASGQVQLAYPTYASARAQIEAGTVRLLAVTGAKRMAQHPDVPTVDELGIPEMVVPIWFGYFAPARTPQPIVEFLHAEFMKALADPQFINSLREQAMEAFPADQKLADAPAFVAATVAQSKEIVARTGIRIEE